MLKSKNGELIVFVSGMLVLLISTTMLFGWLFNMPALVRITSNWEPMVVNTAICGLLAATTLVLSNTVNPATFLRMQKITGSVILAYQYVIQIYIAE